MDNKPKRKVGRPRKNETGKTKPTGLKTKGRGRPKKTTKKKKAEDPSVLDIKAKYNNKTDKDEFNIEAESHISLAGIIEKILEFLSIKM